MERAFIYGDSLLKATMPDADMRYHFHLPEVMAQYPSDRLEVVNRAKMGATVTKGLALVEHDVQRGMDARWALVAYGGNDSDFDWEAVAAAPEEDHLPHTTLPEFTEKLCRAVTALKSAGVQPVLMTLPPIDGQRYFRFISKDGRRQRAALAGRCGTHLPPPGAVLRRGGGSGLCRGRAPYRRAAAVPAPARPVRSYRRRWHPSDHVRLSLPVRHAGRLGARTAVI